MANHQIGNLQHGELIDPIFTIEFVAWKLDFVAILPFADNKFTVRQFVERIENSLDVLLVEAEDRAEREVHYLAGQFGELVGHFERFRYAVLAQRCVNLPQVVLALQFAAGIVVWKSEEQFGMD